MWHRSEICRTGRAWLAGGFLGRIDADALTAACLGVITSTSDEEVGDLAGIAELPGLANALSATLCKARNADSVGDVRWRTRKSR